jgi:predicted glycoside hydrolase/deacetylase ChbG (UPF0249 family)
VTTARVVIERQLDAFEAHWKAPPDYVDGHQHVQQIDGWLNASPAGSIIMCHPAQAAEPGDVIGGARAQEFAYLSGVEFPIALAEARVQLVRGDTWY